MFSLVLRPRIPIERLGLVTTALGVACAQGIARSTGLDVRLKWPNDVIVEGRKLAGVLVESRIAGGGLDAAVGGAGVNVAYEPEEFPPDIAARATSIVIEMRRAGLQRSPSRPRLLAAILASFDALYPALDETSILAEATLRSDVLGERVTVRFADGRTQEGTALRLTTNGALEIETDEGVTAIDSGEIETLRAG